MGTTNGELKSLGYKDHGLDKVEIFKCLDCGEEYPRLATTVGLNVVWEIMCNGRAIKRCAYCSVKLALVSTHTKHPSCSYSPVDDVYAIRDTGDLYYAIAQHLRSMIKDRGCAGGGAGERELCLNDKAILKVDEEDMSWDYVDDVPKELAKLPSRILTGKEIAVMTAKVWDGNNHIALPSYVIEELGIEGTYGEYDACEWLENENAETLNEKLRSHSLESLDDLANLLEEEAELEGVTVVGTLEYLEENYEVKDKNIIELELEED